MLADFFFDFMPMPIHLRPDQAQLLRSILAAHVHGRTVLAFGSRVAGNVKPMSDLDVW